MTRYVSTRGEAPALGFCDVMLTGLARDGGLYVPEVWPQLAPDEIAAFLGRPYWEVAVDVIRPFVAGEISDADLGRMANEAYATFRHPAVVPLDQIGPNQFMLELFHGPTLAFKDVAMQLIARLMDHVLAQRKQRITIVVATSGDTGGAAVEAFANLDSVDLVVLFPHGRISEVQRRMMTTSGARNVHALAIEGHFDDCQAIVKALFNHHSFRDQVSLSGVNSINWARIVAQVVYYFTSAVALGSPQRTVDFTVPTGNFGDIFAGFVAKRMGLPIRTLRIAANSNDILARTLKTGIYEVRDVHATASPSMDIQVSSNFERLLFEASGRDASVVRGLMASLSSVRPVRVARCGSSCDPQGIRCRPRRRNRNRRRNSRGVARGRRFGGSAYRGGAGGSRPRQLRLENPEHRAVDGARGEISRCGGSRLRHASAATGLARRSDDQGRARKSHEERSG